MTTTPSIPTTPVSNTPSCWESFTTSVSNAMTKVAQCLSRLWLSIKSSFQSMCAAIRPKIASCVAWVQTNQQQALVVGGVTAVAAAIGAYFFCCNKDKTVASATATAPATGTPANANANAGTTGTGTSAASTTTQKTS